MKFNNEDKQVSQHHSKLPVIRCCPSCGSQNLATIKRGFYALDVYFPTKQTEKKCFSCNHEFDTAKCDNV
jgi:rubredoxin